MLNLFICLLLACVSGSVISNGFWFEGSVGLISAFIFTVAQFAHSSKEENF